MSMKAIEHTTSLRYESEIGTNTDHCRQTRTIRYQWWEMTGSTEPLLNASIKMSTRLLIVKHAVYLFNLLTHCDTNCLYCYWGTYPHRNYSWYVIVYTFIEYNVERYYSHLKIIDGHLKVNRCCSWLVVVFGVSWTTHSLKYINIKKESKIQLFNKCKMADIIISLYN